MNIVWVEVKKKSFNKTKRTIHGYYGSQLAFSVRCAEEHLLVEEPDGSKTRKMVDLYNLYGPNGERVYSHIYGTCYKQNPQYGYSCLSDAKRAAMKYFQENPELFELKPESKLNIKAITSGDNDQFYPTPEFIAGRMFSLLNAHNIGEVLEPSAGNGALLNSFIKFLSNQYTHREKTSSEHIDVIEKDPELQVILKGKGYRVVFDDFLQFRTMKKYNTVIMNPPFKNGDQHLLKAMELIQDGGQIVSLLNAETLRNPYSNSRKLLKQKLSEYNAKIIYIKDAFKHAARKTDVEIAIVYINIPKPKHKSKIFETLHKAEEQKRQQAKEEALVKAPNNWMEKLIFDFELESKAGIALIEEYFALLPYLEDTTSRYSTPIFELRIAQSRHSLNIDESINLFLSEMRERYWRKLLTHEELSSRMTSKMQVEYNAKLKELKDYDFSLYNIEIVYYEICSQLMSGVHESIMSLFDTLSAQYSWFPDSDKNIHYYNGWATNKAHKVGNKVIIPMNGAFAEKWRKDFLDTYRIAEIIRDLERSLNFLDRGETKFRDPNFVSLERANQEGVSKNIPFTYFDCTFYKKGTCHIKFHADAQRILDRLNIYAAQNSNWLPPSYGKKKYKDMSQEEQRVVDEFQGEKAYEEIMQNPGLYLTETKNCINALPVSTI